MGLDLLRQLRGSVGRIDLTYHFLATPSTLAHGDLE